MRFRHALGFVILLALLLWWMDRSPRPPEETSPLTTSEHVEPTRPTFDARDVTTETTRSVENRVRPGEETEQPSAIAVESSTNTVVRGRCVAAESSLPLAGCRVKLDGFGGNQARMALHGPVTWEDVETTSGDDGVFTLRFVAPPPFQFGLDVQATGRVPRTARWSQLEPGQVVDLGDVPLTIGYRVQGRVTDEDGRHIEKAGFGLEDLPLPLPEHIAANDARFGWTQADGSFEIDVCIPPGTWRTRFVGPHRLVEPLTVTVIDGVGAPFVNAVVETMASITGRVVDLDGLPIMRAHVQASGCDGRAPAASTNANGEFVLRDVCKTEPVTQLVVDRGPCEAYQHPVPVAWGTQGLLLMTPRAQTLDILVVDGATGEPVEEFSVVCHCKDFRWSSEAEPRQGGHHEGGRLTIRNVLRGENILRVLPRGDLHAPSRSIEFAVTDAPLAELRVELQRRIHFTAEVVFPDGTPVSGSAVELIECSPGRPLAEYSRPLRASIRAINPQHEGPFELETQTTDARGIARFTKGDPQLLDLLALRVRGKTHVPTEWQKPDLRGDHPRVRIVVTRGATLQGRVTPTSVTALGIALQLREEESNRSFPSGYDMDRWERMPIPPDGTFTFHGLPPGPWNVHALVGKVHVERSLARIELEEERITKIELDLRDFVPGRVEGCATVAGKAPPGAMLYLNVIGETTRGRMDERELPPSGEYAFENLVPGRYRLLLGWTPPGAHRTIYRAPMEAFVLLPGESQRRDFDIPLRTARLRILDANGQALLETSIEMSAGWFSESFTSDGAGWITITPAPLEPVTFRFRKDDVLFVSEDIRLQVGTPLERDVTLRRYNR